MTRHLHVVPDYAAARGDDERQRTAPADPQQAPSPIRVLLADDHELMRRSLRDVLDREAGIEVLAETCDLDSTARCIGSLRPDVLVLDRSLRDGSGLAMLTRLRARSPQTQVVLISMEGNPGFALELLAVGGLGFVAKELADDELPTAVRAAARGERFVSPRVLPETPSVAAAGSD